MMSLSGFDSRVIWPHGINLQILPPFLKECYSNSPFLPTYVLLLTCILLMYSLPFLEFFSALCRFLFSHGSSFVQPEGLPFNISGRVGLLNRLQ